MATKRKKSRGPDPAYLAIRAEEERKRKLAEESAFLVPMGEKWTAAELEELPTLAQGQADDLKIDAGDTRIWLCRCGVEDGMPFNNAITVEKYKGGRWVEEEVYEG